MMIRPERVGDLDAIGVVTQAAFRDVPYSDHNEHLVIERLRRAGALAVSLVAEENGAITGHIGFSPVGLSGSSDIWFGLGPLSVLPERQGRGVGSALVHRGFDALRELNASGCVVMGDPAYYRRFGFRHDERLKAEGIDDEYFMILPLQGGTPSGIVRYHQAFFGDIA